MDSEKGFIKWLVLAIIALALLKYFLNWDIFAAAETEEGQGTIAYIAQLLQTVWSYIGGPIEFIWSEILWPLIDLFWQTFKAFIEWGQENARNPVEPVRFQ